MVAHARRAFIYEMFGSAPVPRIIKKTRVQLAYREKKRISEVQTPNPQWTQEKISQIASKEFDKAIGRVQSRQPYQTEEFLAKEYSSQPRMSRCMDATINIHMAQT